MPKHGGGAARPGRFSRSPPVSSRPAARHPPPVAVSSPETGSAAGGSPHPPAAYLCAGRNGCCGRNENNNDNFLYSDLTFRQAVARLGPVERRRQSGCRPASRRREKAPTGRTGELRPAPGLLARRRGRGQSGARTAPAADARPRPPAIARELESRRAGQPGSGKNGTEWNERERNAMKERHGGSTGKSSPPGRGLGEGPLPPGRKRRRECGKGWTSCPKGPPPVRRPHGDHDIA